MLLFQNGSNLDFTSFLSADASVVGQPMSLYLVIGVFSVSADMVGSDSLP